MPTILLTAGSAAPLRSVAIPPRGVATSDRPRPVRFVFFRSPFDQFEESGNVFVDMIPIVSAVDSGQLVRLALFNVLHGPPDLFEGGLKSSWSSGRAKTLGKGLFDRCSSYRRLEARSTLPARGPLSISRTASM